MTPAPGSALRRRLCFLIGLVSAVALPATTAGAEPPAPKRFIVQLQDSVADPAAVAREHARRFDADVDFVYTHAIKGYAGTFRGGSASQVASDGRVRRVEPDGIATKSVATTQSGATWGLDRIDQRSLPLSGTFTYTSTGKDVTAYVIDSGIRFSHSQFGGRASSGPDYIQNDGSADDCDGHGTHVAGTIGGSTYGVAKSVQLVAVRVLNCSGSGSWSGVIAGVDWVTGHHAGGPAVANMSLSGGGNSAVDAAVRNSIADGVSYVIAAGNSSQNACNFSPSRVAEAMTIGATTSADRRPSWSNWGSCVDWFAPGNSVKSAASSSDTATATMSGTSMAAPHTAGVAALYLESNPSSTAVDVSDALYGLTTKGVVARSKTTNNHLLYSSF